jgi:hypothetical protein
MALDNTRILEKFFAHQKKQAQRAQRAELKARKAVNKARALQLSMMSLMRIMSQSSTTGRNTHKTSPANPPNENPSDRKDINAPSQYKLSEYSKSNPLKCRSTKNDSSKSGNKDLSMSHTTQNTPPCAILTTKNPLCKIMTTATTNLAATTHNSAGNQPANSPPIFAPRAMTKTSIPRPTPPKVSTTMKDHPHAGTFSSNHNHKITQKPTEQHPPLVSNYIDKTKCTGGDPPLSNRDKAQSKSKPTSNLSTRQLPQSHDQYQQPNGKHSENYHRNKAPPKRKGSDKYLNLFPDHPS